MQIGQLSKSSLTVLNKVKNTLPLELSNCLLGSYPREMKLYVHSNVYNSFIPDCQKLETNQNFSQLGSGTNVQWILFSPQRTDHWFK